MDYKQIALAVFISLIPLCYLVFYAITAIERIAKALGSIDRTLNKFDRY